MSALGRAGDALMSEKGSEAEIEPRRFNVAEVPEGDIEHRGEARSGLKTKSKLAFNPDHSRAPGHWA